MKRFLLLALLTIVAVIGIAAYLVFSNHRTEGPLTGEQASKDIVDRRPVAVTIDNISPDARPQSGLAQASLVFEALAEGGITRFMAVYLEHDASSIGPVRSTRLYFNSWAAGLHVIFGHDGGNVDALHQLPGLTTIYNEDADSITGPFYRITTRVVPHNEYTSSAALRGYAAQHGADVTGSGVSFPHKDDAPPSSRPAHAALNVQFSYSDYNVTWQYDRVANDYLRFMGGSPHVDAKTGTQLRTKNVVVMYVTENPASDPFTPNSIHLGTEGSGRAVVYGNGTAVQGTWSEPDVESPLTFLDGNGHQIVMNRFPLPGWRWCRWGTR